MKKISILVILMTFFLFSCGDDGPDIPGGGGNGGGNGGGGSKLDTIEYRAQIWVDKSDLERYGGERQFKLKLKEMFRNTTRFWNESENKFKYYFRFVPSEEMQIYDIQGDQSRYEEFRKKSFGIMDTQKHDFVVFFALNAVKNGASCGGGGKSGQSVVMCYQTLESQQKNGDIFSATYPQLGMYSILGHEYGHVRGATDLYQYIIKAEDNPVSHEALVPPPCNMGTGTWVWSEYCSYLFNYTAKQKQLEPDLPRKVFPAKLRIKVLVDGQPKRGLTMKFYGTRAGGSKNNRDVYPKAFKTFQTDKDGLVELTNLYDLYHPAAGTPNLPPSDEFPYAYWFCFLVEVTNGTTKKYIWVPDWATQVTKMKGADLHEEVISF